MTPKLKAKEILDMLSNRSGFGDIIDNLDEDIMDEIIEEIVTIIK